MQVFWGRCNEEPGAPPYWPWLQLLRSWLQSHDDEVVRRVLGGAASPLAEILPDIARRLPDCEPLPPIADPMQARFRLFDAMSGFWKRAAAEQPLLLILDNLHWADASSLRLLEFLAPDLASSAHAGGHHVPRHGAVAPASAVGHAGRTVAPARLSSACA